MYIYIYTYIIHNTCTYTCSGQGINGNEKNRNIKKVKTKKIHHQQHK